MLLKGRVKAGHSRPKLAGSHGSKQPEQLPEAVKGGHEPRPLPVEQALPRRLSLRHRPPGATAASVRPTAMCY